MNDLINELLETLNVDNIMLYISAMDHARKIKFSSYVHLPSISKTFSISLRLIDFGSVGEVMSFEHGFYISALEHVRKLILSSYVLLSCINPIYKYGHAWVI